MEQDIISIIDTANELFRKIGLSEETIRTYQERSFNKIVQRYASEPDFQFQSEIMAELIQEATDQHNAGKISRKSWNWRLRGINILNEIHETGTFQWKVYHKHAAAEFPESFKSACDGFICSLDLSKKRLTNIKSITLRFCVFINDRDIKNFHDVSANDLLDFLVLMHENRPQSMDDVVSALKKLFRYLEKNDKLTGSQWQLLSAPRSRDHKVKPAIAQEEVMLILGKVDRKTSSGKRDFAILSLAITTGLRAGDIATLSLENILWKEQEIHLVQGKTGKRHIIPLHISVRAALADYILNGRPKSESRKIFLRSCAPYTPFSDGVSIACIFRKYLKAAGLSHSLNDGKTFHGVRRSIGTYMVSHGVPVTTVSQVLGHHSIRVTRQYISLDTEGLSKCILPMSSIGGAHGIS